jgi:hypothetical protein
MIRELEEGIFKERFKKIDPSAIFKTNSARVLTDVFEFETYLESDNND